MPAPSEEQSNDSKDSYEELEHFFYQFHKYHVKILSVDFNAIVGGENIFKLTFGNESLRQDDDYNVFRIVNLATSNNVVAKSIMFPHRNISTPGSLLMGRLTTRLITY